MTTVRLDLLESGLARCNDLLVSYPENVAVQSVAMQIGYLIALERGLHSDRSRLKDVTIGVLTAREIEPIDDATAELFFQIASAAKTM